MNIPDLPKSDLTEIGNVHFDQKVFHLKKPFGQRLSMMHERIKNQYSLLWFILLTPLF
jgi:hypothetical protein